MTTHQTRSIFLHNPRHTFSAAANAAALKCSGMMMPPLAGDPVTNCIALLEMIMMLLSSMQLCRESENNRELLPTKEWAGGPLHKNSTYVLTIQILHTSSPYKFYVLGPYFPLRKRT